MEFGSCHDAAPSALISTANVDSRVWRIYVGVHYFSFDRPDHSFNISFVLGLHFSLRHLWHALYN